MKAKSYIQVRFDGAVDLAAGEHIKASRARWWLVPRPSTLRARWKAGFSVPCRESS
jgi:hypothetical protein